MITATSLPRPDFFSETETTPEDRQEAAVSAVIQGWDLEAIAKPWEDQIKPNLEGRDQLQNVMEVCNGRVKDITQACDHHVRALNKELDYRVSDIFQCFSKIVRHFNQHRNINGIQTELSKVISRISAAEVDSERVVLALKARLKAVQKEWDIPMERLKKNRFKRQAQLDQAEAIYKADIIYKESMRQVEETQYKFRSAKADLFVMGARDTVCNEPQARIDEIEFIYTHLLPLLDRNTRKAFFEKNEEAKPALIFLTAFWYAFGNLKKRELPLFFSYNIRREIQRVQSENPSEDLSISSLQKEKFFADFKEFGPWSCSLKDDPPLEELIKISEKMLENKEFATNFVDCWHACVDFPDPDRYKSYEAYQAHKKKKIEEAKTSSEFSE